MVPPFVSTFSTRPRFRLRRKSASAHRVQKRGGRGEEEKRRAVSAPCLFHLNFLVVCTGELRRRGGEKKEKGVHPCTTGRMTSTTEKARHCHRQAGRRKSLAWGAWREEGGKGEKGKGLVVGLGVSELRWKEKKDSSSLSAHHYRLCHLALEESAGRKGGGKKKKKEGLILFSFTACRA